MLNNYSIKTVADAIHNSVKRMEGVFDHDEP